MATKIILTDEIVSDSLSKGYSITEGLTKAYEGELSDRVKADERLKNFDAFDMAMFDAGISKSSKVKDFRKEASTEWLFPAFIDKRLAETVNNNDILNHVVGSPVSVNATSVQAAYIDLIGNADNKDAVSKKRVTAGTDLPLAEIKLGEKGIVLSKFGRAIQATYETIQYQTVDLFSKALGWIGNDVANQQIAAAVDVLVKGDGNDNAAAADTMTGETLTAEELVSFAVKFYEASGVPLTTIIAPSTLYEKLRLMTFASTNQAGIIPAATFNFPQGIMGDVTIISADVPEATKKAQIIGLHKDYALTKYLAEGSQIRELDRNIRNQTQLGTISEIAGFAKFAKAASRALKMK